MLRILNGLVLLRELDTIAGIKYNSKELKKLYPNDVVVMRRISYIKYDVLCDTAKALVTRLDDYVQLCELAEITSIEKRLIKNRISFMQKTSAVFFEYLVLNNLQFVKLDKEFIFLFENYQAFMAKLEDSSDMVTCKLLGDIKIGFY